MSLSNADKKQYRAIGHQLKPVITIAEKGLSESVLLELERALSDHELIKVKIVAADKTAKADLADEIAREATAEVVQSIGHMLLLFRAAKKPNPRLSNLLRNAS